MNNDVRVACNTNKQMKFKTTMLKTSLCDYSDVYILVNGIITAVEQGVEDAAAIAAKRNKQHLNIMHYLLTTSTKKIIPR